MHGPAQMIRRRLPEPVPEAQNASEPPLAVHHTAALPQAQKPIVDAALEWKGTA